MPEIALVVLGLFVLVWIISAVVKASQQNGASRQPGPSPARSRPASDSPRIERTSNSDIDRFMAEIDRLRRRGEGAPGAGRPAESPRPAPRPPEPPPRPSQRVEPRPRPTERDRERERRERERRPRPSARAVPPPPERTESVPVLRPVAPESPAPPAAPPPPPPKPARPARMAALAGAPTAPPSAVLQTLQTVLKSKQGPAVAIILAEIFGEPPGRRGTVRPPHHPKHG